MRHPCFKPRFTLKNSDIMTFSFTLHFTSLYSDFNAQINLGATPFLSNFDHIRLRFILSYALLKSMKAIGWDKW